MTDNTLLERVRNLLAKAEDDSVIPAEAEALTAKAAERMARYGAFAHDPASGSRSRARSAPAMLVASGPGRVVSLDRGEACGVGVGLADGRLVVRLAGPGCLSLGDERLPARIAGGEDVLPGSFLCPQRGLQVVVLNHICWVCLGPFPEAVLVAGYVSASHFRRVLGFPGLNVGPAFGSFLCLLGCVIRAGVHAVAVFHVGSWTWNP